MWQRKKRRLQARNGTNQPRRVKDMSAAAIPFPQRTWDGDALGLDFIIWHTSGGPSSRNVADEDGIGKR